MDGNINNARRQSAVVTKHQNCIMTNENNELNLGADDGLNGLPEKELAETKEILDEIGKEDAPKPGDEKEPEPSTEPKKPEEVKPADTKVEADKKPEDIDGKKTPEQRRDQKLVPAWLLERAKADHEKREKELTAEIETFKRTSKPEDNSKNENPDISNEAETFAEKHGITVELAQDMINIASRNNGKLPTDIEERLNAVDEMRNNAIIAAEATAFNADFDRVVLPLIKAEYGDNVPAHVIEQVREDLKVKAYTPEYAKVPYATIYKGEDQFRGVVATEKKGAEGGRGGSNAQQTISGEGTTIDLTKPIADDVLKTLTDAQFDEYERNMEQLERSRK